MPTFTTVALERLLDPTARDSHLGNDSSSTLKQLQNQSDCNPDHPKKSSHIYISPALYTTPEPRPIPDTPTSVSPSPYVYNGKRRNLPISSQANPSEGQSVPSPVRDCQGHRSVLLVKMKSPAAGPPCHTVPRLEDNRQEDGALSETPQAAHRSNQKRPVLEDDNFLDLHASMSVSRDGGGILTSEQWKHTFITSQSEFYDASEEFLSDGSSAFASPSTKSNIEAELRATRIHLLDEIERRKQTEQALDDMCKQWQKICTNMSHHGLTFLKVADGGNVGLDMEFARQLCEEVMVARAIAEAVGRGCARAEAEAATEAVIDAKNHEITRLRDKLQYYEALNQEMSLRNQEIVGTSRQERLRRKKRQKWMWTCFGISIIFGASVLGYLYFPRPGKDLLPASSDSCVFLEDTPGG